MLSYSVPVLRQLSNTQLAKLADVLEEDFFQEGEHIIHQGGIGDTFFIINVGTVKVTQKRDDKQEVCIRELKEGDYFGEKALLENDKSNARRTANVIATSYVSCLTVDREHFRQLLGDIPTYEHDKPEPGIPKTEQDDTAEFAKVDKKDLIVTGTLGMGGFGRVELVCTYWLHLFVRLLVVCCCWYRDYVFTYICIMHSRINV